MALKIPDPPIPLWTIVQVPEGDCTGCIHYSICRMEAASAYRARRETFDPPCKDPIGLEAVTAPEPT